MEHKPVQSIHSISPSTDNRQNETDLYTFSPMLLCSSVAHVLHSFCCCTSLLASSAILHCTAQHYTALYCIVLYCIVLYCIVLYCIVLYCIVLYCIVLYSLRIKKMVTLCCGKRISRLWTTIEIIITSFKTRLQYRPIYVDIVFTLLEL